MQFCWQWNEVYFETSKIISFKSLVVGLLFVILVSLFLVSNLKNELRVLLNLLLEALDAELPAQPRATDGNASSSQKPDKLQSFKLPTLIGSCNWNFGSFFWAIFRKKFASVEMWNLSHFRIFITMAKASIFLVLLSLILN